MRTVGVVTVSRSDYGIYLPVLRAIQDDPALQLRLIVAGMHLAPAFGSTVGAIESDGFIISDRVDMLASSDTPEDVAQSMGRGTIGFARCFARCRPDLLLVLGDRFEMHAAAVAALPFKIPVAHIHGGELTQGAFDDALRHSMTKLSHLHFAATVTSGKRIEQLGEEPWRITVSGAPALDHLRTMSLWSRQELEQRVGVQFEDAPLLVTYHPVTLAYERTEWQVTELLAALRVCGQPVILTLPNADTYGHIIRDMCAQFVASEPRAQLVPNLGTQGYFSVMAFASAMVGNSSSGLIEAPSFGLPVVNIGQRQHGRLRADNVIDVGYTRDDIAAGIHQALQPAFRERLRGLVNPYGDGDAARRIVARLKEVRLDDPLIIKPFVDMERAVLTGAAP